MGISHTFLPSSVAYGAALPCGMIEDHGIDQKQRGLTPDLSESHFASRSHTTKLVKGKQSNASCSLEDAIHALYSHPAFQPL